MKSVSWLKWLLGCGGGLLVIGCQSAMGTGEATTVPLNNLPSISEVIGTAVPTIPPLPTLNPAEVARGQQVYTTYCAGCHGINLEGEADWKEQNEDKSFRAPPHNADGHTWHHADSLLLEAIELGGGRFEGVNIGGTSNMPAFGEILTDEEKTAVLTYIKSTWPEETRATQWEVTVMTRQR